jgi:hypothetical protein
VAQDLVAVQAAVQVGAGREAARLRACVVEGWVITATCSRV